MSGCRALAAASLVHGLDHHPAGAAHPALRGERHTERSLRGVDAPPCHKQQPDWVEEIKCVLELENDVGKPVEHELLTLMRALVISCLIQRPLPLQAGDHYLNVHYTLANDCRHALQAAKWPCVCIVFLL